MAEKSAFRKYSSGERQQALQRAREIGLRPAGEELGIPWGTIAHWRYNERSRRQKAESEVAPQGAEDQTRPEPTDAGVVEATDPTGEGTMVLPAGPTQAQAAAQPASLVPPSVTPPSKSKAGGDSSVRSERPDRPSKPDAGGRRVAKVYTPSQRAEILEYKAREGAAAASRKFNVSLFSIHDWERKVRLHSQGEAANSPVIGSDEDKAVVRDQRILREWKAHPGLGPSQVRNQLRRQGLKVSVHTVRCVLEENGYVPPKVRREAVHDARYEAVRPNHLWHLDFLHRYVHKQKIYILLVLDDYSRFIVGGAIWDGERVAAVQETFLAAVERHGRPEKAMSDGGSAFHAWRGIGEFTRSLEELEVDQLIASIPEVNGKLEVLNANVQKELFNREEFFDLGEAQRRLSAWIHFYNFRRTHHALGGLLVPADRYFGRADEVLACIEAGRSPDAVGEPIPPGERHLDLFRVTSHRGQVEIHLLGHRLRLLTPTAEGGT